MLDSVTKKRIDDLRNILVGKIPSPQSQVEQITTGLIYKFMYDMDNEAIEMGGVPSFFIEEFEKYSWKHLFEPKLGGVEKVKLYSDAIENLYNNPHAPSIFREIFKNSFLPFKDPSTLNMFLKEINEFNYSNSEKLGDAYEYLLSFMGSQGDAGQFRTPRHIIDFIIEIVNPAKNDSILDPACGSSGFLISSYKHILKQNTETRIGDQLNASERKKIGENLVGYDIDPAMTRISLVNMYLHNFASPNISEYDTLSSEDKWNEYFDVILANPPFFSPTGGIKPHSRFGIQSTRAEVLFVDYIMEHLKPNGRAGIIVPEGIIFQTGTAYKTLRKKLIEDCLVGVVSLPSGVFQPYSGVKTSILILDKQLNKKLENIFFAKVENDGFSLGSQRKPINHNDLPSIIKKFKELSNSLEQKEIENFILKKDLLNSSDVGLIYSRYKKIDRSNSATRFIAIGEVCNIINGSTPNKKNTTYWEGGNVPWFTIEDLREQGYLINDTKQKVTKLALKETSLKVLPPKSTLLCCTASVGATAFNNISVSTNQQFNGLVIKEEYKSKILPEFLFWVSTNLKDELIRNSGSTSFNYVSVAKVKEIEIPLPSLKEQRNIVNDLEEYKKIINGCEQVVNNYKPSIDIDPSWEMVELKKLIKLSSGQGLTKKDFKNGEFEVFGGNGIAGNHDNYFIEDKTIVIGRVGAYCGSIHLTSEKCWITDNGLYVKEILQPMNLEYLALILRKLNLNQYAKVGGQPSISQGEILRLSIPMPELSIQNEMASQSNHIQKLVNQNNELIKLYSQKSENKINQIWGI
tara:strand:- start:230 stop:2635 length:2406 start_codon:yes stop_codon:yes gene_type:complete